MYGRRARVFIRVLESLAASLCIFLSFSDNLKAKVSQLCALSWKCLEHKSVTSPFQPTFLRLGHTRHACCVTLFFLSFLDKLKAKVEPSICAPSWNVPITRVWACLLLFWFIIFQGRITERIPWIFLCPIIQSWWVSFKANATLWRTSLWFLSPLTFSIKFYNWVKLITQRVESFRCYNCISWFVLP